ncbi:MULTISPECIES: hypothetical protein [unclassified Oceanispirochaeta]|uniref:hypothetical protein n=1 Tax=unclassified Oceanispirochaeta TaxID=2635722 RepID=UPI000E098655|nr:MULTISPECIES: hypothetical protein [unclassified Oceanispirochaeta]MBF9018769.1 hypothetical protein [Oceanispirochaeta sp. M2]NPD75238.1 hypothetical protein [Oceanispirochaeta sp. M1]RDG28902.1 hypothetical protein DV872_24400 [Oceanispirochaeta sp. M1]
MEKLQALGKDFPWEKPISCPKCSSSHLWGHGFVLRCFFGFASKLWIKRYRCDDCWTVFTVRPVGYPPGFQYPWEAIRNSVLDKIKGEIYRKDLPRQNQQYWLKAFLFQKSRVQNWHDLDSNQPHQKEVTFRLNYQEIPWPGDPPYLPFAVTVKPPAFNFK